MIPDRLRFLGLVPVSAKWRGVPGVVRDILNQVDGSLYLRRIYLLPFLYLHHIAQADHDRHLHSHPWRWAKSLILTGGYLEHHTKLVCTGWTWRTPGTVVTLSNDTYHRIVLAEPGTWTLFLAGPRTQSWGFRTEKGHVDFMEYLATDRRVDTATAG